MYTVPKSSEATWSFSLYMWLRTPAELKLCKESLFLIRRELEISRISRICNSLRTFYDPFVSGGVNDNPIYKVIRESRDNRENWLLVPFLVEKVGPAASNAHNSPRALCAPGDPLPSSFSRKLPKARLVLGHWFFKTKNEMNIREQKHTVFRNAYIGTNNKKSRIGQNRRLRPLSTLRWWGIQYCICNIDFLTCLWASQTFILLFKLYLDTLYTLLWICHKAILFSFLGRVGSQVNAKDFQPPFNTRH